jgi:hypothetical protein
VSAVPVALPGRTRRAADPSSGPRDRSHLRVVPPRQRRFRVLALVGVLAVVGSLFTLVAFNSELAQGEFRMNHLDQQLERAQLANERLRLQVARLGSPASIVDQAKSLGLVVPLDVQWVDAPAASRGSSSPGQTADTLADVWRDTKASLAPGP